MEILLTFDENIYIKSLRHLDLRDHFINEINQIMVFNLLGIGQQNSFKIRFSALRFRKRSLYSGTMFFTSFGISKKSCPLWYMEMDMTGLNLL